MLAWKNHFDFIWPLTKVEQTYRKKLQLGEKNNAPAKMISLFKLCLRNTNSRMRETNKTQLHFLLKTIDLKIVVFLQKILRFQVILLRQMKFWSGRQRCSSAYWDKSCRKPMLKNNINVFSKAVKFQFQICTLLFISWRSTFVTDFQPIAEPLESCF